MALQENRKSALSGLEVMKISSNTDGRLGHVEEGAQSPQVRHARSATESGNSARGAPSWDAGTKEAGGSIPESRRRCRQRDPPPPYPILLAIRGNSEVVSWVGPQRGYGRGEITYAHGELKMH